MYKCKHCEFETNSRKKIRKHARFKHFFKCTKKEIGMGGKGYESEITKSYTYVKK